MKPAVDGTTSPLQIAVPEEAANSLVEFDASTRYPVAVQGTDYLISSCKYVSSGTRRKVSKLSGFNSSLVGLRGTT